jgi:hypothetical protein
LTRAGLQLRQDVLGPRAAGGRLAQACDAGRERMRGSQWPPALTSLYDGKNRRKKKAQTFARGICHENDSPPQREEGAGGGGWQRQRSGQPPLTPP